MAQLWCKEIPIDKKYRIDQYYNKYAINQHPTSIILVLSCTIVIAPILTFLESVD